ncbi:MAG: hypothetical protein ACSLFD_00405 [Solirubrobacterales bacterium]
MRTRLLSTLALLSLIVLASAMPANAAQAPIPSIKKTREFKQLKTYVNFLQVKRNTPASNAQKGVYKAKLKTRRTSANLKATALYNRRILRISKRDDGKQRRQIRQIRHNQKIRVAGLTSTLNTRLARLNASENAAVDRVNAGFNAKINPLSRKRAILQKRLDKTTNPVKRTKISGKITQIQRKLNSLVNARQASANAVVDRYNARANTVKNLITARIARVQASARKQVRQAKAAYKRLFRQQISAAKQRKAADVTLITAQRDRGAGFIEEMPPVG